MAEGEGPEEQRQKAVGVGGMQARQNDRRLSGGDDTLSVCTLDTSQVLEMNSFMRLTQYVCAGPLTTPAPLTCSTAGVHQGDKQHSGSLFFFSSFQDPLFFI